MVDDDDSSSDDENEEPTAMAYPMMMPYGYAAYPSAYSFAASGQAYPGYTYQAGYPGYGSAEYAAYMQSMSAAGYATGSSSGTPGIATDPMSAYYGAAYGAGQSFQYGTVKTFILEKGFGFIESALPSQGDVFFSKTELSSDLQSESETDLKGKPVQFEVTMGKDNRSRAVNVQLCSLELVQRAAKNAPKPKGSPSSGIIKSFSERHGYGFLALENDNGDAQFRGSDLAPELLALGSALAGRMVKCQIHELRDGKIKATDMVPIPGQAGKSSGKGKTQALQRVRGKVKTFNPDTRLGTATCTENSDDVTFFDLKNLQLVEGAEVSFLLKTLADGAAQGMDLCLGDSDVKEEPKPLMDGTTVTATVKSFNDTRGFGFLKIPGAKMDLYFHGRDMDEASQGLLMMVGASGLANCNATCRVEARTDGRWNGRNVSLLEAGVQMMDGMKMAGMIRYFYDHKGFGFINVTGNPIDIYFQGRDVGPDAQTRCEKMGAVGTVVWFTLYAQTDSRWQAKDIVLAGDGSSVGGLTPEMLGGKGWGKGESDPYSESHGWDGWDGWDGWGSGSAEYGKGSGKGSGGSGKASLPKVEKQIIPGCELVGRLKSYNAEKHFGFISVDGQPNDVYFQVWDLVDTLKSQVETLGSDGSGLSAGALVRFSLQLMPGGGRLRARDMTLSPNATLSTAADVEAAVQKAAAVAHEAIIPGSGSILHDGAQVSGKVRIFNQDRGFGFVTVDADETDLYFHIKDMLQEDQQKVSNGLKLPGQRVWFRAEMLDNSMSGRWRCHDISLTFRRAAPPGVSGPPAKRQKTDGPGSGQKVNGS